MGIRPTVRGSVMNPNDHPHGGGEGKTVIKTWSLIVEEEIGWKKTWCLYMLQRIW